MIFHYCKIACRNLLRNKLYTSINILGLALGILSCLVIWVVCRFELSFENFQPDRDNIYRVVAENKYPDGKQLFFAMPPDPAANAIRSEVSGIAQVADIHAFYAKVTVPGGKRFPAADAKSQDADIVVTSPEYFQVFNYQWLIGSPEKAISEPFKVVLTESKAYKYFGRQPLQDILGKTLVYADSLPITVAGIVKDYAPNTNFRFSDFVSISTVPNSFLADKRIYLDQWGGYYHHTQVFVKLLSGTIPGKVNTQLTAMLYAHVKIPKEEKHDLRLQPLSELHFDNRYSDFYSRQVHLPTLYGLLSIAAFILIIAVVNFINLSTTQSIRRSKEIGVRKVMGSTRKGLILQFLGETFLIVLLALLVVISLIYPMLMALHAFVPDGAALSLFNWQSLWMALALLAGTTLLAGIYPAIVLSGSIPAITLKGPGTQQRGFFRKVLVVFQFTVSLVFIIGTLVVQQQLHYVLHSDLGFKSDAVINIATSSAYKHEKLDVLADMLRRIPGVNAVSEANGTPAAATHWGTALTYNGGKEPVSADCEMHWIDEHFVPLYQLKILAGRNVHASDSMREFLINESAMKALGFARPEDAIGKMAESGMDDNASPRCPIVGVVADFHSVSMHEQIKPAFFTASKMFATQLSVKLEAVKDFGKLIDNIGAAYMTVYPTEQFDYKFFDETIAGLYAEEQQTAAVMNVATTMAIVISCMGLLGLAAFSIRQRTREIGLRKVMGASVGNIVMLLTRNFIGLVGIAILIATPLALYAMNKWLEDFAYRIHISIWLMLLAGAIAISIAVLTVSFQAISAALANPVKSLKNE
jgi:ABC-type antimicrobial peptide transport system permease subunit